MKDIKLIRPKSSPCFFNTDAQSQGASQVKHPPANAGAVFVSGNEIRHCLFAQGSEGLAWRDLRLVAWSVSGRVRSLGQKDSLGEEMAIHFSILVWKIPWTKESGRLQSMGSQRVRHG